MSEAEKSFYLKTEKRDMHADLLMYALEDIKFNIKREHKNFVIEVVLESDVLCTVTMPDTSLGRLKEIFDEHGLCDIDLGWDVEPVDSGDSDNL